MSDRWQESNMHDAFYLGSVGRGHASIYEAGTYCRATVFGPVGSSRYFDGIAQREFRGRGRVVLARRWCERIMRSANLID